MTVERLPFTCPVCSKVLWLTPGNFKRKKVCSLKCRNKAQWVQRASHGYRLRRVMFVTGLNAHDAAIYLKGWSAGRSAAMQAYLHGRRLIARKVGSREWESGRGRARVA